MVRSVSSLLHTRESILYQNFLRPEFQFQTYHLTEISTYHKFPHWVLTTRVLRTKQWVVPNLKEINGNYFSPLKSQGPAIYPEQENKQWLQRKLKCLISQFDRKCWDSYEMSRIKKLSWKEFSNKTTIYTFFGNLGTLSPWMAIELLKFINRLIIKKNIT